MATSKSFPSDNYHIESITRFCKEVETLVETSNKEAEQAKLSGRNRPRLNYMQAVLVAAERRGIEETLAATYLSPDIKNKIKIEAENLNLIPKTASLPF